MTTWISVSLTSVSEEQSNSISISLRISLRYALCILKFTNFHVFRGFLRCEIWGSHTDVAEDSSLRECCEVSTGKYLQELRSVTFPLCSRASSLGRQIWIFFSDFSYYYLVLHTAGTMWTYRHVCFSVSRHIYFNTSLYFIHSIPMHVLFTSSIPLLLTLNKNWTATLLF
jgi:hypothetical protein